MSHIEPSPNLRDQRRTPSSVVRSLCLSSGNESEATRPMLSIVVGVPKLPLGRELEFGTDPFIAERRFLCPEVATEEVRIHQELGCLLLCWQRVEFEVVLVVDGSNVVARDGSERRLDL